MPSEQNSGAGILGKPGSKSGPAAKPSSETTGADISDQSRAVPPTGLLQDSRATWKYNVPSGKAAVPSEVTDYLPIASLLS